MKVVLVLLLCGFSSALGFDCNKGYPEECRRAKAGRFDFQISFPETAADLDDFCNDVFEEKDCYDAFDKECNDSDIVNIARALRGLAAGFETFLNKTCDREDPLRQKYLEKASCLKRESQSVDHHCNETVNESDKCRKFTEVTKCAENELVSRCGADGQNLVSELLLTRSPIKDLICNITSV